MRKQVLVLTLLVVAFLTIAAASAPAECRTVQPSTPVVHQVVQTPVVQHAVSSYHAPTYAPTYVPTYAVTAFLEVPIPIFGAGYQYGIGYGGAGAGGAGVAPAADVQELREELRQIRRLLQGGAVPPVPPVTPGTVVPPAAQAPPGGQRLSTFQNPKLLEAVQQNCASCHGLARKEKGLALLAPDGKSLAALSAASLDRCFRQVARGAMPPDGKKLTDEILRLFDEWAESLK